MTNLERIKQMDAEGVADWIDKNADAPCEYCIYAGTDYHSDCVEGIKAWLEQEVEE